MNTRGSVLVIDDEPGIRDMLSFELKQEGFDVETAESGIVAVQALKRRAFDLALTDLRMPGMDGVATLEALRELDPNIAVIVASGYANAETASVCMERGADDYIQKPFDLDELRFHVERAMQKSQLQALVALHEASRALFAALDFSELVELGLKLSIEILHVSDAALLVFRGDGFDCHCSATSFQPPEPWLRERVRELRTIGQRLCGTYENFGLPTAIADQIKFGSALLCPLWARERPIGTLATFRRAQFASFSPRDLERAGVFASALGLALDNARCFTDLVERR